MVTGTGLFSTGFHSLGTEVDSTSGTRLWKPVEKSPVPLYRCPMALTRRELLRTSAVAAPFLLTWDWKLIASGDFAQALVQTPAQTEGPFYPDKLPLDTDNDLLDHQRRDHPGRRRGSPTLTGRILDANGTPIRNAVVEIWQCDNNGAYLHSGTATRDKRDKNFQGFGRFLTGSTGEYYFRTIKPVPYPGRTPHIHYKVKRKRPGHADDAVLHQGPRQATSSDGVLRGIRDAQGPRTPIMVDFTPIKDSEDRRAGRQVRHRPGRDAGNRPVGLQRFPDRCSVFRSPTFASATSLVRARRALGQALGPP